MSDSIYGARIAIYNKPLCEVLDRYKEQGTFEKSKAGSYRHQVVIADTDEEKHVSLSYYFRDGSGAFSVTEVPQTPPGRDGVSADLSVPGVRYPEGPVPVAEG